MKRKGRRTKFTADCRQRIINALRGGAPRSTACKYAGVTAQTFYGWLAKGRGQQRGPYRRFLEEVDEAEAVMQMAACRTIMHAIEGGFFPAPVYDKHGRPVPDIDQATGEQKRDENGRLLFLMRVAYTEPNARIAQWFLERRVPECRRDHPPGASAQVEEQQTSIQTDACGIPVNPFEEGIKLLAEYGLELPGYIRLCTLDGKAKAIADPKARPTAKEGQSDCQDEGSRPPKAAKCQRCHGTGLDPIPPAA